MIVPNETFNTGSEQVVFTVYESQYPCVQDLGEFLPPHRALVLTCPSPTAHLPHNFVCALVTKIV